MYGIKDCTRNIAPWSAVAGEFLTAKKIIIIMDKSLGTLLHFLGVFCFAKAQLIPSPHKQSWTCVSRIFTKFQLYYRLGEGELQENFEKDACFYEGTQKWQKNMNTALLSQGLLSMIVDAVPLALNNKFIERTVYNYNIARCMEWGLVRGTLHHNLWWQVNSLHQKKIITTKK